MKELPRAEMKRIRGLLPEDEARRNRNEYVYAADILSQNSVVPSAIWPAPNRDVRRIRVKKVEYEALPLEDQNELEKGLFFYDQRRFVAEQCSRGAHVTMLCEAFDYAECLLGRCPLFVPPNTAQGGRCGICREYKLAFKK